jgi:ABC-type multidrug transport system fused ATPase/permease subunit
VPSDRPADQNADVTPQAGIFTGLAVVQGVLLFISSVFPSVVGIRASRNLSDEAMWRIMSASVTFFEGTPLGRIVQRFSGDVDILDNTLTDAVRQFLTMISAILGSVILIIIYYYYFAIAAFVGTGAIIAAVSYYQKSAREIKRHHAVMEGASFARFSEGLIGAGTIRAYGVQAIFVQSLYKALDDSHSAYFLTFANQRWLAVRLDSIGNLLTFTVALLVAIDQFSVSPSVSGLVLSYSMSLGGLIQILIKYFAEVENGMSSTERLHEYATSVPFETTAGLTAAQLRPSWPERGQIEYSDVTMRYRPDLPVVIDKFSLQIRAGERIGIVGRTGAGKSTILSTIFRLYDLQSGNITIDGIDIASVSLKELRSRLAIVPQDPTLFQGTIRSNLDPENCHSDLELWQALRQAHLNPSDPTSQSEKSGRPVINIHLDDTVEAEAANLSLGQRQLLALARVLLRDSRIILVDEGTSSVDRQTDAMIQHTLAHDLQGKTLIAIAHRLRTIINFDRVCVMSKGQIIELGPPKLLWQQGNLFRDMCNANGITEKDFL